MRTRRPNTEITPVRLGHHPTRVAQHIIQEGGTIGLGLKPEQIEYAHRPDQLRVRRDSHEDARGRERGMQEQPDPVGHPASPQRIGQAQQVVVMHPDHIVGTKQRGQRCGEKVVDPPISRELRPLEMAEADLIVQHRPQRVVGEAAIVLVVVLARQIDGEQRDRPDIAFKTGSFQYPSSVGTSPLQPNHKPPVCFNASSTRAANPPAVASPSWIGATRLETTTRRDMLLSGFLGDEADHARSWPCSNLNV